MAQQQWSGPYQPGPPGPPPPPQKSNAVWWTIIAVAAVVLVGVIVWAFAGRGGGEPTPSPTPSESGTAPATSAAPTTPAATLPPPDVDPADEWGPFPPANLEELKDLSQARFPDALGGTFLLDGDVSIDSFTGVATYAEQDSASFVSAWLHFTTADYAFLVDEISDPAYIGAAVCGTVVDEANAYEGISCVMAGQHEVLTLESTGSAMPSLESLASLIAELHDEL